MEYKVRTGDGLKCGFSGKPANVLVKILHDEGTKNTATEWMSREVLEEAFAMIDFFERRIPAGRPALLEEEMTGTHAVARPPAFRQAPKVAALAPAPSVMERGLVEQFRVACIDLAENPPPGINGEPQAGVPELAIRELLGQWRARFQNVRSMQPVVADIFGMHSDRFELSVGLL